MAIQEFEQSEVDPMVEARRRASLSEKPVPLPKYRRAVRKQGEIQKWEPVHGKQLLVDGLEVHQGDLPPIDGRFSVEIKPPPKSGTNA